VARWCQAFQDGVEQEIPEARKIRKPARVTLAAAVMVDPLGYTLLVKDGQATSGLFAKMWQFPAVEVRGDAEVELRRHLKTVASGEWREARGKKNGEMRKRGMEKKESTETAGAWEELKAVRHSVTFREITLRPFVVRVEQLPKMRGARTIPLRWIERVAVSSGTRKIARAATEQKPWQPAQSRSIGTA